MSLLLRRAAGQALIPTAIIAVGIALLLLLGVFRAEMGAARQEGSRGYTPRALLVQAAPADVARALESSGLDAHAYAEAGAGRRILALAPGATLSLPLHSGGPSPGRPQALIGSRVDADPPQGADGAAGPARGPAQVVFEGRSYPVTGMLGSSERSLMQYETLIIDAERFAAADSSTVVIDGPQARRLVEGPLAGARFQAHDQGARRTSIDTFSPILMPLGALAGALSLWAAAALAVAARRQEARVEVVLGRAPLAVRLSTAARIASMGVLGAALAVLAVHLGAGLPGPGTTIGVLGAALGVLAAAGAAGLVAEGGSA